jgi:glycosyltransferase involved in cell wall biosynthesis
LIPEISTVLRAHGRPYEILAIDDGSSDDSAGVLTRLQGDEPNLTLVRFRRNFGQTAAFQAGFDLARGAVVITLDADGQNDPADIPALVAKIDEGYDIASGWRVHRKEPMFLRRIPSLVANRMIARTTEVRLHDTGCSLKAFRSEVVKNLNLYGELHRFIPALASWMGVRVAEVPVNDRERRHGKSKYGFSRTIRVLLDLFTVYFMLSYSGRPMQLFGGLGLVSFGLGTLIGLYLTVLKVAFHESISNKPLLLLAVLLITFGGQLITTGLLAELVTRTYHEAARKPIYAVREIVVGKSGVRESGSRGVGESGSRGVGESEVSEGSIRGLPSTPRQG